MEIPTRRAYAATLAGLIVQPTPTYHSLYSLFPDADGIPIATAIPPDDIPEPYRSLLVHTHHMTVIVEKFYRDSVTVRVLESRQNASDYARKILLALENTGRVVQFGIVQIDLNLLSETVREQILAGQTPLGRVLIENRVLRRIRPISYVMVQPNAAMQSWFGLTSAEPLYGRLGVIDTDWKPAIRVLEILAPVST